MTEASELEIGSPSSGTPFAGPGRLTRDRILSFRVIYAAVFAFLVLYTSTIWLSEMALDAHFERLAIEATHVTDLDRPVASQIQEAMGDLVERSPWVTLGGIRVTSLVLGNDGMSWIYVHGRIRPQEQGLEPTDVLRQAVELLPASTDVTVSVPHTSLLANVILIGYAAALLWGLYLYNRSNQRRFTRQTNQAIEARDRAAERALKIESELGNARRKLEEVEPAERAQSSAISALQEERRELQKKLHNLAGREEDLRGSADRATELSQEVEALEELLEEAAGDITTKEDELRELEKNLKQANRGGGGSRAKGSEALARRLRTLYKNIEFEDRAIDTLFSLRDEAMKLKAEEAIKRLAEEADNVAVRRKVGGLPNYLHIFELGFGGKGRIYYTRGRQQRFRILAVGAKNTQDSDMEYFRGLSREEMS
ncbi:MAG: hypothetical protein OSB70_12445 [Myxococcota bacterium]|nr:hypothetical protein [Myxococcota bacterium]